MDETEVSTRERQRAVDSIVANHPIPCVHEFLEHLETLRSYLAGDMERVAWIACRQIEHARLLPFRKELGAVNDHYVRLLIAVYHPHQAYTSVPKKGS